MSQTEAVPIQPMEKNRLLARYLLLLLLVPLLISKFNDLYILYQSGYTFTISNIIFDGFIIVSYLAMLYFFPQITPIFENTYLLSPQELRMSRFLKKGDPLIVNEIDLAEIYITRDKDDKEKMSKIFQERVAELIKSGFKREDFTNTSENLVILHSKEKFYLLTPMYPKTFIDKLRKRNPELAVKQIELTDKGKREVDL